MMARRFAFAFALGLTALVGVASSPATAQLDSQYVLQRYALAMSAIKVPPAVIFQYVVSQAGPTNIEQRHQIYRSGLLVRDETLSVDGVGLKSKVVTFDRREDRYAIARIAPQQSDYAFVFLRTLRRGTHLDYLYETAPLSGTGGPYVVDRIAIDERSFLPVTVHFKSSSETVEGTGAIEYGAFGPYLMPLGATVSATVDGKAARERIAFGEYRFPPSLPASTFQPPKPLPHATLPPI